MTLSIQIPPEIEAQLLASAKAQGVSLELYLQRMLEQDAKSKRLAARPLKSSYGVLAKHGRAPSAEEIDANRAEMFRNFAPTDLTMNGEK